MCAASDDALASASCQWSFILIDIYISDDFPSSPCLISLSSLSLCPFRQCYFGTIIWEFTVASTWIFLGNLNELITEYIKWHLQFKYSTRDFSFSHFLSSIILAVFVVSCLTPSHRYSGSCSEDSCSYTCPFAAATGSHFIGFWFYCWASFWEEESHTLKYTLIFLFVKATTCIILIIYLYQSNSALSSSIYLLTIVSTNSKYILNCIKISFWTALLCASVYTCMKSVMSEGQKTAFSSSIHAFVFPPSPLLRGRTDTASSNLRFKISFLWIL